MQLNRNLFQFNENEKIVATVTLQSYGKSSNSQHLTLTQVKTMMLTVDLKRSLLQQIFTSIFPQDQQQFDLQDILLLLRLFAAFQNNITLDDPILYNYNFPYIVKTTQKKQNDSIQTIPSSLSSASILPTTQKAPLQENKQPKLPLQQLTPDQLIQQAIHTLEDNNKVNYIVNFNTINQLNNITKQSSQTVIQSQLTLNQILQKPQKSMSNILMQLQNSSLSKIQEQFLECSKQFLVKSDEIHQILIGQIQQTEKSQQLQKLQQLQQQEKTVFFDYQMQRQNVQQGIESLRTQLKVLYQLLSEQQIKKQKQAFIIGCIIANKKQLRQISQQLDTKQLNLDVSQSVQSSIRSISSNSTQDKQQQQLQPIEDQQESGQEQVQVDPDNSKQNA